MLIVAVVLVLFLTQNYTRFPPTVWGKLTTVFEFITMACFLFFNALGRSHPVLDLLVWITLVLILVSGFHYMARTIRWLGSNKVEQ